MINWEERQKILAENKFVLSNGQYKHIPTNKVFGIIEIKELSDYDFEKLIECKCIYEQIYSQDKETSIGSNSHIIGKFPKEIMEWYKNL
jgi:hypothetical protein